MAHATYEAYERATAVDASKRVRDQVARFVPDDVSG